MSKRFERKYYSNKTVDIQSVNSQINLRSRFTFKVNQMKDFGNRENVKKSIAQFISYSLGLLPETEKNEIV